MIAVMLNENENPDEINENIPAPTPEEVVPQDIPQQVTSPEPTPAVQENIVQPVEPALAPAAVGGTTPLATSYIQQPPASRSRKGLIVGLVAAFVVLLAGAGGFGTWYFAMRMPDNEYEKTIAYLDSMIADAASIKSHDSSFKDSVTTNTTVTSVNLVDMSDEYEASLSKKLSELSDAQDKAAEYLSKQELLQKSLVVTKDSSVKVVYDTNKKAINEYGSTSDEYYRTGYIFYRMLLSCSVLNHLSDVTSVNSYDLAVKQCKDYINAHETVPSEVFNDTFYVPYRKIMLDLVQIVHDYLAAATVEQQLTAQQKMLTLYKDLAKIDTSKMDTVKNSQNPTSQLKAVRDKVVERKAIFFR